MSMLYLLKRLLIVLFLINIFLLKPFLKITKMPILILDKSASQNMSNFSNEIQFRNLSLN